MNDRLDNVLLEAYELIESNRADEARELLEPLLSDHTDDADLWWVYAHAVETPEEAESALERVVELDPNLTDASQLLADIRASNADSSSGIRSIKPLSPIPASAGDFNEDMDFEEEDDFLDGTEETAGTNWLLLGGIALLLLLAAGVIIALSLSGATRSTDDTTSVADATVADVATSDSGSALGVPDPTETDEAAPKNTPTEEIEETVEATSETDVTDEVDADDATVASEITEDVPTATDEEDSATATQEPEATMTQTDVTEAVDVTAVTMSAENADTTDANDEDNTTEESVATEPTETDEDVEETPTPTSGSDEGDPTEASSTVTAAPTNTATQIPPTRTRIPTRTPNPTDTPTPVPTPTPDPIIAISDTIVDGTEYELSSNDIQAEETVFGDTLVLEVCLEDNNRSDLLQDNLLALADAPLEDLSVDAIAIAIYDCELDETLRIVGVSLEDLNAFQEEELSPEEFQLSWQVIG